LLYPSASDFQFRYAPVTVGSGRAACVHFSWVRSFCPYMAFQLNRAKFLSDEAKKAFKFLNIEI
jgi:hypothetical protein